MNKDTSGPAFPDLVMNRDGEYSFSGGMTLRQWYAGMAMQALLSIERYNNEGDDVIAKWAFSQADAMLAQEDK